MMTTDRRADDGEAPAAEQAMGVATLGQQAEVLFKEAKALAEQNVTHLIATLESAIRQANEIADGGSLYPAGVRDLCRKLGEQAAVRVQAIDAVVRLEEPQLGAPLEEDVVEARLPAQIGGLGPFPLGNQGAVNWREPPAPADTGDVQSAPQTDAPAEPNEVTAAAPPMPDQQPEPVAPTAASNGDVGATGGLQQVPWEWNAPKAPGIFGFLRGRRPALDGEEAPPAKLPR